MRPVQYAIALLDGRLVTIDEVAAMETRPRGLRCPGCGRLLQAALGDVNVPHFRHALSDPCGGESYLHRAGKLAIAEGIPEARRRGLPYELVVRHPRRCVAGHEVMPHLAVHDLARDFQTVGCEKRMMGFVADVLLTSQWFPDLAIEVVVTHRCSDAKIACGFPIVEVEVSNVDDVLDLRAGLRKESLTIYNWPVVFPEFVGECSACDLARVRQAAEDARRFRRVSDDLILAEARVAELRVECAALAARLHLGERE